MGWTAYPSECACVHPYRPVVMKLSIVIPVYRTQDTLPRCMESVLRQSFTDYEIILVDDGSPDGCPALCDSYAQGYRHVKVIHKRNEGLSEARNAGIDQAEGEYITFMDSDDALQDGSLSLLMHELSGHPDVDILEYPVLERCGHPYKQRRLSFTPHEYTDSIDYWFREKAYNHAYAWNKIYRRHLFGQVRFPKGKTFEDVLTVPCLLGIVPVGGKRLTPKIRVTGTGCYIYYWNEKGITANAAYADLHCLYEGLDTALRCVFREMETDGRSPDKYNALLQDFMLQILNVLLDLYDLSGRFEPCPPLVGYVEKLGKTARITSCKLKLLNILGYHTLCRLNKSLHKIYRRR